MNFRHEKAKESLCMLGLEVMNEEGLAFPAIRGIAEEEGDASITAIDVVAGIVGTRRSAVIIQEDL